MNKWRVVAAATAIPAAAAVRPARTFASSPLPKPNLNRDGTCGSYLRDSRHVTEHSERVCPRPAAIGYVSHGRVAAF
jgi:hypothetical protein